MNILISGYYGYKNIGDEAVLSSIILGLKKFYPHAQITVLSADIEATQKQHKVEAIPRYNFFLLRKAIMACDVFISGGGSLFQDRTSARSLYYYLSLILLAKYYGKKVIVFGQGFGPIKLLNTSIAKRVLRQADYLFMRDIVSAHQVLALKIPKQKVKSFIDPAFILERKEINLDIVQKKEGISFSSRPVIGVSPRNIFDNQDKTFHILASALDHLVHWLGAQIVFIPFRKPEDIEVINRISYLMKEKSKVLLNDYDPGELLTLVAQCDFFIGMRLHSLIFSALANVPMLGLSYDPKVSSLMLKLNQPSVNAQIDNLEHFMGFVEYAWNHREFEKEKLQKMVPQLKILSNESFVHLSQVIFPNSRINLLGIDIDNLSLDGAFEKMEGFIQQGKKALVFTPNPEMLSNAYHNLALQNLLNSANINLPDGAAMLVAARAFGLSFKERVCGIDALLRVIEAAKNGKYSLFFYGARPEVIENAVKNLRNQYPKIKIVGFCHGYYQDTSHVIKEINRVQPDFLFVGLGFPQQEKWLIENKDKLDFKVAVVVGGSFDVVSGLKKRAPLWVQKANIEWVFRLLKEPWRVKRQVALLKFIYLVIMEKLLKSRGNYA